jgi:YVTN family beta-propeller protein
VTNNNDLHRNDRSSLTPIDPVTGKPGPSIPVTDAYNMYFMPDGSAAIVVNEAQRRLDFRDPVSMKVLYTIEMPDCYGLNHADFSADGTYALFSCEFGGAVAKVDLIARRQAAVLKLSRPEPIGRSGTAHEHQAMSDQRGRRGRYRHRSHRRSTFHREGRGMPQDVRISPDGKLFYVADMVSDGVYVVDGEHMLQVDFLPTGVGAHGFVVSRDGKKLYVANRGSHLMPAGAPHGDGSVSVIDFATRTVETTWDIPGGGSPDMGGLSADGKTLWFSGRFDDVVYAIDTATGSVTKIPVGSEPHGLAVWPQPGRYSLGHTGNMR